MNKTKDTTKTMPSKQLSLYTAMFVHDKLAELAALRQTTKAKLANRILDVVVRDRALIKQVLQIELEVPKEEKVEVEKPKKELTEAQKHSLRVKLAEIGSTNKIALMKMRAPQVHGLYLPRWANALTKNGRTYIINGRLKYYKEVANSDETEKSLQELSELIEVDLNIPVTKLDYLLKRLSCEEFKGYLLDYGAEEPMDIPEPEQGNIVYSAVCYDVRLPDGWSASPMLDGAPGFGLFAPSGVGMHVVNAEQVRRMLQEYDEGLHQVS